MAQVIEHLPSKVKALSSKPKYCPRQKKKEGQKRKKITTRDFPMK
jgi:hypothetical protein